MIVEALRTRALAVVRHGNVDEEDAQDPLQEKSGWLPKPSRVVDGLHQGVNDFYVNLEQIGLIWN